MYVNVHKQIIETQQAYNKAVGTAKILGRTRINFPQSKHGRPAKAAKNEEEVALRMHS